MVRRFRNKIGCLKDDTGNLIEDQEDLKTMATNYYSSLFTDGGGVS